MPRQPGLAPAKGAVFPHQPTPSHRIIAWAVFVVEKLVTGSLRCRWSDRSGLAESRHAQPVIFCLWHNRLASAMMMHRRHPVKVAALVSASKDGALLAAVLGRFRVEPVRGSTSRRGPQALLELTTRVGQGYNIVITPDGPKGPRYVVQPGVIALAQVTGLAIIPVTSNVQRKLCLKSWDSFQIPLPFSRCDLVFNEPIRVPREADEVEREQRRRELESVLRQSSTD
ncbi:MAG TPA: lysophospholipid acyltransferase family protein [Candidatus Acidoferrum sp.]|nr:lysophospholipid acyltransferase family protein [Candidatus Acidoferrum sp.]